MGLSNEKRIMINLFPNVCCSQAYYPLPPYLTVLMQAFHTNESGFSCQEEPCQVQLLGPVCYVLHFGFAVNVVWLDPQPCGLWGWRTRFFPCRNHLERGRVFSNPVNNGEYAKVSWLHWVKKLFESYIELIMAKPAQFITQDLDFRQDIRVGLR